MLSLSLSVCAQMSLEATVMSIRAHPSWGKVVCVRQRESAHACVGVGVGVGVSLSEWVWVWEWVWGWGWCGGVCGVTEGDSCDCSRAFHLGQGCVCG